MKKIGVMIVLLIFLSTFTYASGDQEAGKTELFFFCGHGDLEEGTKEIIAAYEETHPNIKITTIFNSKDYATQFQSMMATDTLPDIVMVDQERLKEFVAADMLLDLSDRPVASRLFDVAKEPNMIDGRLYSVPFHLQGYGMLYNPKLLAQAHINKVPSTLSELKAAVDKLNAAGITPFTSMFNETWAADQYLLFGISPILNQDPSLVAGLYNGTVKFSDAKFSEVFNYIDILKDNVPENPFSYSFGEGASYFGQGKAALAIHGDWILRTALAVDPNLDVHLAALPYSNVKENNKIVVGVANGLGIIKNSKHLQEAIDFFDYYSTLESAQILSKYNFSYVPQKGFDTKGLHAVYTDISEALDQGNVIPWEWLKVAPGGVKLEAGQSMQAYLSNQISQDQVMENVQAAFDDAVK
ncbi:ABC transporter substrate-binding protein [Sediminispirochaeta smaragdinae]|uniref:Probable sugar-binding periplasmic protein n=1 Tax=Sediminispirochaeta smaragdinae (strain DSM 11293 / JCM 15392 / SEBR 4228) TaxID=573413 RepID=E1R6S2_SEDSS|nr:extracellular solute-binding protein [Sediminispirochaeta smaragdinae]ADK79204.1 extracellular solute-binding protein family 1 [Sediminispirochaeta smaragdinae DSM 11293]